IDPDLRSQIRQNVAYLHGVPTPYTQFRFQAAAIPPIFTLSLHDALPIFGGLAPGIYTVSEDPATGFFPQLDQSVDLELPTCSGRSEEHTSELQSRVDIVCRLLLEKKKKWIT